MTSIGNLSFQAEQEHCSICSSTARSELQPATRPRNRPQAWLCLRGMVNDEEEQKAIDDLQDVEWMGRMVRVGKACRERSGGPRGGGGGGGGYRN